MPFLELKNIKKTFGDVTAVEDMTLEVEEGEFISILGPSGSGKTTTLKVMAGFQDADTGEIIIDGDEISHLPPEDRNMSMVFQRLSLFPHMSVHNNIAYGLRMRTDMSEDEIEQEVTRALEMMELPGYGDRDIRDLSGGEQQRVALARAIVVEPDVLLFDEPLSDLDRQLRENMRREIAELHDSLGITSIYVTHNQREALTLSDRIAIMESGELIQFDTPNNIYTHPENQFIADFVGDSNFVEGTVTKNDDAFYFEGEGIRLPLSPEMVNGHSPGDATLYIRPEDIRVGEGGDAQRFPGTIESVVHLGSTTEYVVQLDDGLPLLVTTLGPPEYSRDDATNITINQYNIIKGQDV